VINLTDMPCVSSQYPPRCAPKFVPSAGRETRPNAHAAVIPPTTAGPLTPHVHHKLEAAVVLRGLVQLVLDQGPVEVRARTWYREGGTHYLEAQRRDSGERMVVRLDEIRDVRPY
jgi:hypothetical protein